MLLMVSEMLRSIASPSYVPRESVTVCDRREQDERPPQETSSVKYGGQKNVEVGRERASRSNCVRRIEGDLLFARVYCAVTLD